MPELARLQGWMQAVITHPCCAEDGLASPEASRHLPGAAAERLVRGGRGLDAVERLGIYQSMHRPRMRDALASDYPSLLALLGEDAFEALVRDYVQAHPSRSYTLNRLGDRLPEYLEGWGPRRGRALRVDLARLELAMTEAFDAAETPPLAPAALASIPAEAWPGARLVPIAALRLLELSTGALEVQDALRAGEPLPRTRRRRCYVLVHRRDYAIRRRALGRAEFLLLREVVAGGPIAQAISAALAREPGLDGGAVSALTAGWAALGLFHEVVLPLP